MWFDERHEPRRSSRERQRSFKHVGEADEARITDNKIDGFGYLRRREDTRAGLFVDDDTAVLAEFPRERVGSRIDRINSRHPVGQQYIGKTAR